MNEKNQTLDIQEESANDTIRIELGDWLYNAGIVGFIKILSENETEIDPQIIIDDTFIEFKRDLLDGFTEKFFEVAFEMHGKFDSIKQWLEGISVEIDSILANERIEYLGKKYRIKEPDKEKFYNKILDEVSKRWKGVAYKKFKKIKKSEINSIDELKQLVKDLLKIQENNRSFFVEKEVQTFLRRIVGMGSFLNKSVSNNQKATFKKDFEKPIIEKDNKKDKNFNCIYCNSRKAKNKTIFSTGLVFYQGLNKDSLNFVWGFNPKLPLCEICELIYFCHWAGYTKSSKNESYLFVNDDSSIKDLWDKNQLLSQILKKDKEKNLLIKYFYELLVQEQQEISRYTLQNITIIETDLANNVMPKVLSLHISRNQAQFIKTNHENLKWLATKYYKIKDDYTNVLHHFLQLMLGGKLNYRIANRLIKYYLQSQDDSKSFVTVNFNPSNIQNLVLLTASYFETVKQKPIQMEKKHIWHVYYLGNEMRQELTNRDAKNKINGIAYRLLNAVRANDKNTFLNVLLRLYIGYDKEVPSTLVNTLESEDKFQIIGHSYVNGLLGQSKNEKSNQKQKTS